MVGMGSPGVTDRGLGSVEAHGHPREKGDEVGESLGEGPAGHFGAGHKNRHRVIKSLAVGPCPGKSIGRRV